MTIQSDRHIVTGAFGYTGKYICKRLMRKGLRVRTLTNSTARDNPFDGNVEVRPLAFDSFSKLVESMNGASTFYNTYWVRFNHSRFRFSAAVENTLQLIKAAKEAGVQRFVHVSITNPSLDSPLEYFRDKAILEKALIESGLSYAILRPTVLFGQEDILINNIAWVLRRFPVFGVFGSGEYRLQPMYVDDFAALAVKEGESMANVIIDAIGPETFTYREMVEMIGRTIGKRRRIVSLSPELAYLLGRILGGLVNDTVITRDEVRGLMGNLLVTYSAPAGQTRLSEWVKEHSNTLGTKYHNEIQRRVNRTDSYENM